MPNIKSIPKPSPHGLAILRTRLSLRETQAEFAKRFHVTMKTIGNWETGRVVAMLPIYQALLDRLVEQLAKQGHLIPLELIQEWLRKQQDAASRHLAGRP